jgi:hypothetical protein
MKVKNLIVIGLVISGVVLSFSGCGGNKQLSVADQKILDNKNKGHIVFIFPASGGGWANFDIYQIDQKNNFKAKRIAKLKPGSKAIVSFEEGEYLFSGRRSIAMIKINVKKGQTYYIDGFTLGNTTKRRELRDKLINKECSDRIVDGYMLEEDESFLDFSCSSGKITEIEDDYTGVFDFNKIGDWETISTSPEFDEEASKEAANTYPIWNETLKGVPLPLNDKIQISNEPFIHVFKIPNKDNYKTFSNVKVTSTKTDLGFEEELKDELDYSEQGKTLFVDYKILKYTGGSHGGRLWKQVVPFARLFSNPLYDASIIHVKVDFYTETKQHIGAVELSRILTKGWFGGSDTNKEDMAELLKTYIDKNFIKD